MFCFITSPKKTNTQFNVEENVRQEDRKIKQITVVSNTDSDKRCQLKEENLIGRNSVVEAQPKSSELPIVE